MQHILCSIIIAFRCTCIFILFTEITFN